MKKSGVLMITGLLIFLLIGCGKGMASPDSEKDELSQAYYLYETGEYESAQKIFQEYKDTDECQESALIGCGKCAERLGDMETALEAYNAVLELKPDSIGCLYNRAYVYDQIGDDESAYFDYKKIYELDQSDQNAKKQIMSYLKENALWEDLLELLQNEGTDEAILAEQIELLAVMGREKDIPELIEQFGDAEFRNLCSKQLEAYQSLRSGNTEKAKKLLFTYENFPEDMEIQTIYLGEHNERYEREGQGILISDEYPDMNIYVGSFKDGKMEGNGSAFRGNKYEKNSDEGYAWEWALTGMWKNDFPNGMCDYCMMYYDIKSERTIYEQEETYSANYTDGVVNGELLVNSRNQYEDGRLESSSLRLMVEDGISVSFLYDGKEVFCVSYDENGNVDRIRDDWRNANSFKWGTY